ncbi:transcription elongation factor GreA [Candidatus Dojkabacteria bacterium]|uniref:Transcription elongation factor GreA n=1 Tax=Candidatus Dojkabacteria bacterium TaxID=2099670 RepID=A0A955L3V6_9BACT|nr:transcription elongation factor GreA [Candidatus Dojkabacteria bacterium]
MNTNDKKAVYLTKEGLEELRRELEERTTVTAKEIADKTEEARRLGDLSENAEYKAALEDREFNITRIHELEKLIQHAVILTGKKGNAKVDIGDKVTLRDGGPERVYRIVGAQEANPAEGMISNESPIGLAILGKKKGDKVVFNTPGGEEEYTIVDVE